MAGKSACTHEFFEELFQKDNVEHDIYAFGS